MSSNRRRLVFSFTLWLGFVLLSYLLQVDRWMAGEFWAEDGFAFFPTALNRGVLGLFDSMCGNFHTFARIIALIATLLSPLHFLPHAFIIGCAFFYFAIFWLLTSPRLDWLLDWKYRCLFAALLAIAPGSEETVFNLANLHHYVLLSIFLTLMQRPFTLGPWKITFLTVAGLSTPAVSAAAIYCLCLYLWNREKFYRNTFVLLLILQLFHVIGAMQPDQNPAGVLFAGRYFGNSYFQLELPWKAFLIGTERFFTNFLIGPFIGDLATRRLVAAPGWIFWLLSGGSILLVLQLIRKIPKKEELITLISLGIAAASYFALIYFGRRYASAELDRAAGSSLWYHRYSFVAAMQSLLFWLGIAKLLGKEFEKPKVAMAVVISMSWALSWTCFDFLKYRWESEAALIEDVQKKIKRGELESPQLVGPIHSHPHHENFFYISIK